MKAAGIICEYNPFHNGHLHHINETRKNGATHIVAVMSGNFVQRGDAAVLDKFTRADIAVRCGADLVIELPVQYSLAPAELFARGAVSILNSLGVINELSFGSECGNTEMLIRAANELEKLRNDDKIRELTENGMTYPKALAAVLAEEHPDEAELISHPNNVLAVEYIKAIKYFSSPILPFTVTRKGSSHDSNGTSGEFASASYIREYPETAGNFAPAVTADALRKGTAQLKRLEPAILYRLRTASFGDIAALPDSGGLAERLYAARQAATLDEVLEKTKTKRFTMARIRRLIFSLLIGIRSEDMSFLPPYGHILALNEKGREILSAAKGRSAIPFDTSLARLERIGSCEKRFAELESRASDIYGLAAAHPAEAGQEYRAKIRIRSLK